MQNRQTLNDWLNRNRDVCIELLRIYLGVGLFLKGLNFGINEKAALELLSGAELPFVPVAVLHVATILHLAGGAFLAFGFLTRIAALAQIPILFGAVFYVHLQEGLFSRGQMLELTLLVLFLLILFAIYGGGRFSVDAYLDRRLKKQKSTQPY